MYWHNYTEWKYAAEDDYGLHPPLLILSQSLHLAASTLWYRVAYGYIRVFEPLVSKQEVERFEAEERPESSREAK